MYYWSSVREPWSIPKHKWDMINLCYSTHILEKYKNTRPKNDNYVEFYKKEVAKLQSNVIGFELTNVSRMTPNAAYVGLLDNVTSTKNEEKSPTEAFREIEKRCNGRFEDTDKYYDLFEQQVEKMFINVDENNPIVVHPLFVIYKILLLMYEYTKEYRITRDEFFNFVIYTYTYQDVYQCIDYILKSRNGISVDDMEVNKFKGRNLRILSLLEQLKTLKVSGNIELNITEVDTVRKKIEKYEQLLYRKGNSIFLFEALYSKLSLFEYFEVSDDGQN